MHLTSFGNPTVFNMHISYVESMSINRECAYGTLTLSVLHSDIDKMQKTGNCFSVVCDKEEYTFSGVFVRKTMFSEHSIECIDVEFDFSTYEKNQRKVSR